MVSLPSDMRRLLMIFYKLSLSLSDYLASRVPGHPRAFFPVSDGLRTCWDSPKPLCTKLAFWLRVPGGRLSEITDSIILVIREMKKAQPGAPAFFADTRSGVLIVPVPAAVSGQLHFPCAPPHRGKRYLPYDEIFLHLISGLPVLRKGLFFLRHESGVFRVQILHLRDPFDAQFIKGLLRRFVNRDLFAVSFEELAAVTGLTVCFIGRPGVGVIEGIPAVSHRRSPSGSGSSAR